MRREIPAGAAGQVQPIMAHGPNIVRVLWFVKKIRQRPEDSNPIAAAGFEALTHEGETYSIVDELGSGWLRTVEDIQNVLDEVDQIGDQLMDFRAELMDLVRKHTPEQLELFDEEDYE